MWYLAIIGGRPIETYHRWMYLVNNNSLMFTIEKEIDRPDYNFGLFVLEYLMHRTEVGTQGVGVWLLHIVLLYDI